MLFSDPKWGNGCLALIAGVIGFFLLNAMMNHFGWSIPRPVAGVVGFLILLGIVRFILNQIFD